MRREHDDTFYVYMHISPSNKRYIGITCQDPINRWGGGCGYKANNHFANAIKKYGWENFEHIILCAGLNKEDACSMEKEMIAMYRSNDPKYGYNLTDGGEHYTPSEEVIRKISHPHNISEHTRELMRERGRLQYEKCLANRARTAEEIAKMATAKRGKKQSKETIAKRIESCKRYWAEHGFSEEHREKLRKARTGRKHSIEAIERMRKAHAPEKNARSRRVAQIDDDGTIIAVFASTREAMRQTGIGYTSIVRACGGKRLKHAGDYKWAYI